MSFEDLLGEDEPPKRSAKKVGRPRKEAPAISLRTADLHEVLGGVSVVWLQKAFRLSREKVIEALRPVDPVGTSQNGGVLYDLREAAAYLVEPVKDVREWKRNLTAKDLPQELREGYWNAKTKEAKYRVLAGDLWPTESILEVLGETFKTIKNTTLLWSETIDESKGLTNDQRILLTELVDRLLAELHEALVTQAKLSMTESFLSELQNET